MVLAKALASCLEQMASTGSIVGVSDAANGWFDARFSQTLGISNRNILASPVAVVDQPAPLNRTAGIKCLLKFIHCPVGDCVAICRERRTKSVLADRDVFHAVIRKRFVCKSRRATMRLAKVSIIKPLKAPLVQAQWRGAT
jgi:hypothetical protein